jgi:hypothetical protein
MNRRSRVYRVHGFMYPFLVGERKSNKCMLKIGGGKEWMIRQLPCGEFEKERHVISVCWKKKLR